MTTEKMSIHQALVELKTLDKRIESAIREGEWVVANKHSNGKIGGVDLKEFVETVKARHQKVTSLIARAEAIKRAVVNSNAVTKVTIAGKEYTVAEAIEMKNNGIDRLRTLVQRLSSDYSMAKTTADRANGAELERRADDYVRTMIGNTDVKGMTDEVKRLRDEFIKAQTMELVDPIGVLKQIELLNEQINSFEVNVDSALSVSNALTSIEISY
ncbi:hypothetical protein [Paenibacillus sp.]